MCYPSSLSLSVYLTEKDFEIGNQYMSVRYEMIEYIKSSNIKDDMENYKLYIDNQPANQSIEICERG